MTYYSIRDLTETELGIIKNLLANVTIGGNHAEAHAELKAKAGAASVQESRIYSAAYYMSAMENQYAEKTQA